jgi:cobalt-zinc-cadmium efflux system outer membrane protein
MAIESRRVEPGITMQARRWIWVALVVICGGLAGCAGPRADLGLVSDALNQLSGHGLTESKAGESSLPPNVSFDDGLSEDEAVAVALWNNAAFLEALADLGISRAELTQAGMLPNPTLSMLVPIGAKPLELTAKYPFEILWLRPERVASAKFDYERTAQRLVQSGLDLIRDVRVAFADLVLAGAQLKIAGESLALNQRIAELSQARLRAGEVSELESGAATIDALQAAEQVSRLGTDVQIAGERLRHLLGLGIGQWTEHIHQPAATSNLDLIVDLCLTNALATRPDLLAAQFGLEAAGKRIGLARAETFTLAAGVNGKDVGSGSSKEFLVGPIVDLAVPILNQNQGGVSQARAKFEKASRQYFTVRDRIILEVREAHARLAQSQQSRDQWQTKILPGLEESVRRAEKAYAAGEVSYLFLLETSRKRYDALLKEATVAAEMQRATAELERSIGRRLDKVGSDSIKTGK